MVDVSTFLCVYRHAGTVVVLAQDHEGDAVTRPPRHTGGRVSLRFEERSYQSLAREAEELAMLFFRQLLRLSLLLSFCSRTSCLKFGFVCETGGSG